MNCYLCDSTDFNIRKGAVRDAPDLKVLECTCCGLVALSSLDHIQSGFYEDSGMHGAEPIPIETWLKNTEWDDQRRFDMLKSMLPNKKLLDFGCGAAGFLNKAKHIADTAVGVELEQRVREHWDGVIPIHTNIKSAEGRYDLITAFHVIEHLHNPKKMLSELAELLDDNGCMVVEVPSSDDALLTIYDSNDFQDFTYWSQHLFLFNPETLKQLAAQAGLRVLAIQQYQRYPISNHLHWLSQGKPGGHHKWSFLDSHELNSAYANSLAAVGRCDTIIGYFEKGLK